MIARGWNVSQNASMDENSHASTIWQNLGGGVRRLTIVSSKIENFISFFHSARAIYLLIRVSCDCLHLFYGFIIFYIFFTIFFKFTIFLFRLSCQIFFSFFFFIHIFSIFLTHIIRTHILKHIRVQQLRAEHPPQVVYVPKVRFKLRFFFHLFFIIYYYLGSLYGFFFII